MEEKDNDMTMGIIMAFIKANWKVILGALIVLGLVLYVEGLRVENARYETDIVSLKHDNDTLKGNNATLEAAIVSANAALIETDKAATKANNNMTALGGTIKQQTADLKQHMDQILAEKTPTNCGDTITYLVTAAGGYPK